MNKAEYKKRKPRLTHVGRVSTLEYFLNICQFAHKSGRIRKTDISDIVIHTRKELEKKRPISSLARISIPRLESKIRSNRYLAEGAIKDTIKLCLDWRLLESATSEKDVYFPTTDCAEIGTFMQKSERDHAKLKLLDVIIKSGMDRLFDPQNFFLKIRNNTLREIKPFVIVSKKPETNGNRKEKIETRKIQLAPIPVPEEEGKACDDYRFIYEIMHTNPVSFPVILDWGYFFRFVNFFSMNIDIRKEVEQLRKKVSAETEEPIRFGSTYPTKGVYLCKILVSFQELMNLMVLMTSQKRVQKREQIKNTFGVTSYIGTCMIYAAQRLGLISLEGDDIKLSKPMIKFHDLLDLALKRGHLVLSDGEGTRGIISSVVADLDPKTTYLVLESEWSLESFLKALWANYYELVQGKTFLYASIFGIRERVCQDLRIHNDVFDEYLEKCRSTYPSFISLSLGSAEIRGTLKAKRFEKAFMVHDRSYYLIKVKEYSR
jgi:hypothetical protein